jgi:hypothetical protein
MGEPKIYRAIFCLVSGALSFEVRDHLDHPLDITILGGSRVMACRSDSECRDVFEESLFINLREISQWPTRLSGVSDGLVVDIGQVHDSKHIVSARFEMSLEQILKEVRPEVANMGVVVDCWSARVHADNASIRIEGDKNFRAAGQSVEKFESHQALGDEGLGVDDS